MEEFYRQLVDGIAAARKVAPAKVESWIDGGPHTAVKAKEAGLVDHVAPLTDVTEILEHFGLENAQLTRSYPVFPARDDRWGRKPRLAVLVIQGTIVDGKSWAIPLLGYRFVGGDDLRLALREIEGDPKIRGLLVRIDSPGGSALASELIYEALRGVARNKPVVVSIGDTAASGGYYSAVASDRIFAMPGSVTGSIGIWSAKVVISDLLDKFKVHRYHMQKGKNAGLLSYDTRASEEDLAAAMDRLADLYDLFLSRVAEGRKKEKAEVDKVAQGRVWSGQRAMEHKLLDVFGGCYEALLDLKSRAGIRGHDAIDLEYYPKKTLSRRLIGSLVGTLAVGGAEGQTVSAMEDLLGSLAGLASTLTWAMEPWQ
jgi:protease-4